MTARAKECLPAMWSPCWYRCLIPAARGGPPAEMGNTIRLAKDDLVAYVR